MIRFCKYLAVLCMTLAMIGVSSAFANLIVATPDQIVINSEGLYVNIGNDILPIHSIVESRNGYLIVTPKVARNADWQCPVCYRWNDKDNEICWYCGFPLHIPTETR